MTREEAISQVDAVGGIDPRPDDWRPSDAQEKAMRALFDLCDAATEGGLSIGDLVDVIRFALADECAPTLIIVLHMALRAVVLAGDEGEN